VATVDAGVTLAELNSFLLPHKHVAPLDLAAKGSCTIGGNVATNAGGIRFLRYGSLHGSVTGLEVILSDGQIVNTLSSPRKDNTGYDLKQLFIGSEGTLGVITGVSLLCAPLPSAVNVCLLGCEDFSKVLSTFKLAKSMLGEILSAYEFMDGSAIKMPLKHISKAQYPFENDYPFYVLIEVSGNDQTNNQDRLMSFLEYIMENDHVLDGVIGQDETQNENIWCLREGISESLGKSGYVYKYDISLPYEKFYAIVEELKKRLPESLAKVYSYGHVGDANIHLNVLSEKFSPEVLDIIEPWVFEYCESCGGSVSAEHGIGMMKRDFLHLGKSPAHMQLLRQMKDTMDPKGILNPYKMFPNAKE